ncbi:hypothetical protein N7454_011068 [Penicillium verhagenii]|nr:hypothetical protein N7454_011068 [Penicillium verhagenii]
MSVRFIEAVAWKENAKNSRSFFTDLSLSRLPKSFAEHGRARWGSNTRVGMFSRHEPAIFTFSAIVG